MDSHTELGLGSSLCMTLSLSIFLSAPVALGQLETILRPLDRSNLAEYFGPQQNREPLESYENRRCMSASVINARTITPNAASNSSLDGGFESRMSSGGSIIPRPITWYQIRFTVARAKNGF